MRFIVKLLILLLFSGANYAAVVHIGSFSVWANAKKIKTKSNRLGFDAVIVQKYIHGRKINSVLIKNLSNSRATNICRQLKNNRINCFVNLNTGNYQPYKSRSRLHRPIKTYGTEYRRKQPDRIYRNNNDDTPMNQQYINRYKQTNPDSNINNDADFNL